MDLSKLNQNQKIVAGGGILAIISLFLPWYGISISGLLSVNANAFRAGFLAWFGLVLAIAAAVIVLLKVLEVSEVKAGNLATEQLALVGAALGFIITVLKLLIDHDFVRWGLFIGIISTVVVAYGCYGAMKDAGLEMPTKDDFTSKDES
jgi:hypothetical protein